MKHLISAVSLSLVVVAGNGFAAVNSVIASQQRLNALERARELIAPRASTWKETTKELPDPFYRSKGARNLDVGNLPPVTRAELSDRELLRKLAPQIEPSGYFVVGGEPVLLINGKRLKAGDTVNLNYEGLVYQVAISSIESNSFALRLNKQELRRELK